LAQRVGAVFSKVQEKPKSQEHTGHFKELMQMEGLRTQRYFYWQMHGVRPRYKSVSMAENFAWHHFEQHKPLLRVKMSAARTRPLITFAHL
jgi:hypothetical protein